MLECALHAYCHRPIPMIRSATLDDLDALVALEERCFDYDRLSRRNFRYMLTKARASILVDEHEGIIEGYVLVLFHAGTSLARMYSLAVSSDSRGRGLGRALMEAAGIPVPPSQVIEKPEDAQAAYNALGGGKMVVKAQVHAGGRGRN